METTLLVADAHAGWIERWDGDPHPSAVLELREPRTPVSADVREAWLAARTSGIRDPASRLADLRRLESMPFPDHLPHFDDMVVAPGGRIWLRDVRIPGPSVPLRWRIIDHAGTEAGSIDLPPSFQPTEIHEDRILGLWTDDLGVQTVRAFRFSPPPTEPATLSPGTLRPQPGPEPGAAPWVGPPPVRPGPAGARASPPGSRPSDPPAMRPAAAPGSPVPASPCTDQTEAAFGAIKDPPCHTGVCPWRVPRPSRW